MISRLTAFAAAFACIATTTIGWAASSARVESPVAPAKAVAAADAMPVVRLETIVIVGRRNLVASN